MEFETGVVMNEEYEDAEEVFEELLDAYGSNPKHLAWVPRPQD
ncbi:hypothetical protein [Kibdelosporangium phytohabitans]|nr:hypothetical protein [Kibdelosporangium phytohabitans]MBE1463303.1 hypothetical protein [Kibdelosporangium phytohabitans]